MQKMANIFFILSATIALQACINAAPNTDDYRVVPIEGSPKMDQADSNLNKEPHRVDISNEDAKINNDKTLQGQRQKRFYDYFDFDFPPYGSYNHNYNKRDDSHNTGVFGTQDFMLQILKRVQTILSYTRQQALPPPVAHYPVPSFIPFYYIPRDVCDCTPAEIPSNGEESSNDARPTQPTTTAPPADSTTLGMQPANEPEPSPTDDTNKNTPDLSSRLPDMGDEEDGSRPISFVPVNPKTPLKRPPPPVDHGSSQASSGNGIKGFASTTPRPVVTGLPPTAYLPTNSIPTLCDGAVLTCCHRAEVTYDCFKSQGCPNPSSPDNPCDESLILRVINKFQYYYANRRG